MPLVWADRAVTMDFESGGSTYTVGKYGGTYSITKAPWPWWHWRGLLARLRHPHYRRDFEAHMARMNGSGWEWLSLAPDGASVWARERERELRRLAMRRAAMAGDIAPGRR